MIAAGVLAYAVLAVLFVGPAWFDLRGSLPEGSADPMQNAWFLAWFPHALTHHVNPWFTTAINYPDGVNLMWNTSKPLAGVAMAPVTLTLGPVAAYTVLLTLDIVLTALTGWLLLRRWLPGATAWLGGLLFGFSPYMLAQAHGHLTVACGITIPLVVLLLDDILVRRRGPVRRGVLLGVVLACQALLSEETLVIEAIAGAVFTASLALVNRSAIARAWRTGAAALGVAMVTSAVLLAWPLSAQLFGPQYLGAEPHAQDAFVTDSLSPFLPTPTQWLEPAWVRDLVVHFGGNSVEWGAYIGLPLLLLCGWTVWHLRRRADIRVATLSTLTMYVLSMGQHLHFRGHLLPIPLPWRLVSWMPFVKDLLPSRLAIVAFLGIAFIAAAGLAELWITVRRGRIAAVVAVATIAVTLMPAGALRAVATGTPAFFRDGTAEQLLGGQTVLLAPVGSEKSPAAMLWHAEAGVSMSTLGGHVMAPPRSSSPLNTLTARLLAAEETRVAAPLDDAATHAFRVALHDGGVTALVLGPASHESALRDYLDTLAGHPGRTIDGVEVWTDLAPS